MKTLLALKPHSAFILFAIFDIICIGMGMGVPIFCILLGFVVGWFVVRYITRSVIQISDVFWKVLRYALITAGFTFLAMLVLWGPFASYLFNPAKDLATAGIPMILYEPRPSLIGWIVLMIVISPFLQLLTTLFSAYLTLLLWMKSGTYDQKTV